MAKRKQDSDDDEQSLVDIEFEFFDPNPEVDYHALKNLAKQLFQEDADDLNVGELADLILAQKLLGSTVKTDGKESDPYAFLTVLNLHVHKEHSAIKSLVAYVLAKSASNPSAHSTLETLLGPSTEKKTHIGYIFSERLINMPVQVMPPMYRMLVDEINWANDEDEPYRFSHYLFISRTVTYNSEDVEMGDAQPSKKAKKSASAPQGPSTSSFHPEDELIQKYALFTIDYPFTHAQPREADSFGFPQGGRMMLVPAGRFQALVAQMNVKYAPPGTAAMSIG